MQKPLALQSFVAAALFAAPLLMGCAAGIPPSAPSAALGSSASFDLPSHDGDLVHLPQAGAAATVLDAFAPTCAPCAKKLPALLARRRDIEKAGGALVLVAVLAEGESSADAAAALASWGVSAPFLVDRGGALRRQCGVDALPETVVLDARGSVRWLAGPTREADDVVAAARAVAGG